MSARLRLAAHLLRRGGIVAYPTESVYGLGCDPFDPAAVQRLFELKGRPERKGLILLAADFAQLRPLIAPLDARELAPALASWPGPVTWILPAASGLPRWLTGKRTTIACRVTAHPLAAALAATAGFPIVSTSANRSGHRPARSPLEVRRAFGQRLDLILHGALGPLGRPTPIRDLASGRLLRA